MNKAKPRDVAVDGRAGELVIAWSDGRESRYDLEGLRRECPCAHCRELRDAPEGGLTLLQPEVVSATAEVRGGWLRRALRHSHRMGRRARSRHLYV